MTRRKPIRGRGRGTVDVLPSGVIRVRVYVGQDPISGKRLDLTELIPAGPRAAKEAEAARVRLLHELDERKNPRTKATLDQLLDRHLQTLDIAASTKRMYTRYLEKHVRPFVGRLKAGSVDAEVLDSLYAELRRCRTHCTSKRGTDHRTLRDHECDARCRPHECKPLGPATVLHVHFLLHAAYEKGIRWRWVATNPVDHASPPSKPAPDPQPPTADEAARIIEAAWQDPDWGTLVWLTMITGARRGELCALHWSHVDLDRGVVFIRRAISSEGLEKDTKSHQQRRVTIDATTVELLTEHRGRAMARAEAVGVPFSADAYVFTLAPDGAKHLDPDTVSQRYGRMTRKLGITTHLHNLRHYSATELIAAGVDVRTVAGRLGHSGGGVTTLRVYAAWLAEADQRAAVGLADRLPVRPETWLSPAEYAMRNPSTPREVLAVELREMVVRGEYVVGDYLPGMKELAKTHGLAFSTVHRAFALLREWGVIEGEPGERARVVLAPAPPAPVPPPVVEVVEVVAEQRSSRRPLDCRVRRRGEVFAEFTASADPRDHDDLDELFTGALIRRGAEDARVMEFEMEVREAGGEALLTTYVASRRRA